MDNIIQSVDAIFDKMENFTQKDGLIGKPVTHSDKTFLPVISMAIGYGGGSSNSKNQTGNNTAEMNKGCGATGLGAKLCTDAIIIIDNNNVMIAPVGAKGNMSQIIETIPQIISNMSGQQQGSQQQSGQQQGTQQQGTQQQTSQQQAGQAAPQQGQQQKKQQ